MAAANYRLCDRCGAKTYYDSDVDYEDSNLGAMAALCKDCAQTHEITIAKRGDFAELRAAIREWVEATDDAEAFELDQTNAYGTDHLDAEDRVEVARGVLLALAATEEES